MSIICQRTSQQHSINLKAILSREIRYNYLASVYYKQYFVDRCKREAMAQHLRIHLEHFHMDGMFRMMWRPQTRRAVMMGHYRCYMTPQLARPFHSMTAVSSSYPSYPIPSRLHRDHHRRADDVRVHSRQPEGREIEFLQ